MLILFDIDATLISTAGVGMRALGDAGRELFGPAFTEADTNFAGRLDPLIITDLLVNNGEADTPANRAAMRAGYRRHLERRLPTHEPKRALPGVQALLSELRRRASRDPALGLGLLTGNFEETGRLKLATCGINADDFPVSVWGDHSPHDPPARDHLPPIGMARYRERFRRDLDPGAVTIIGDTPHDVGCALAHGCRCLGVATGHFSVGELRSAGAHLALSDLSDTGAVLAWMLPD